jgi:pimeloyl-ACP methyl ester carboxylesterase
VLVLLPIFATPAHAGEPAVECSSYRVPVAVTDAGPADVTLFGQLCHRGPVWPQTVQLLVHGATYNHLYWDFPYQNSYYSYVRAATRAGYATFNVDRLGAGQSSHPPGRQLSMAESSTSLHRVLSMLRAGGGEVGGHPFRHVIWVGHSFGSIYAWLEISRYHDVDAAVLTGLLHKFSPSYGALAATYNYTAALDPLFAELPGVDWSQYLTTVPGTLGQLFYYLPTADPNVIATDEANKDTIGLIEDSQSFAVYALPPDQAPSREITVPVLLVVGQQDAVFCTPDAVDCSSADAVARFEAPYYSAQAHRRVVVIPSTGHDLNLHTTAPASYLVEQVWALAHVPPHD